MKNKLLVMLTLTLASFISISGVETGTGDPEQQRTEQSQMMAEQYIEDCKLQAVSLLNNNQISAEAYKGLVVACESLQ